MEEAEFTNDFEVYEYDNYTLGCACDWPGRDICTCDSVPTSGTNSSLRVRTLVELCCAFIINDIQASQISSHKRKHSGDPQLDLYSIKQIVQETYVDKLPLELVDKLVRVLPWEECCNCKQLFEEHEMYIFYRDEGELSMYVDRLERVSFQRDGSYRVTHGGIVACKSCYEYVLEVINNRKEKKCTC